MKKSTPEHRIERIDTTTLKEEDVRAFLDEIDEDVVCSECGGLPYDIVFSHRGVLYKFCLYKIQRDGVILAETDYEKLYEYTRKDGPMMTERHVKTVGSPA